MKILITGGCGFIGSHLVEECLRRGHTVCILDDLSTGYAGNIESGINLIVGSVLDKQAIDIAIVNCDAVFHLAALPSVPRSVKEPIETARVNIMGTLNVLSQARNKVIIASSSSVYGGQDKPIGLEERDILNPMSPYAAQKASIEALSRQFQLHRKLDVLCLRFFNVYGRRQNVTSHYAAVIPRFLQAKEQKRPALIYGDGKQSRDFTYIKDVVEALMAALGCNIKYDVFNIARGKSTTILELHEAIGSKIKPKFAPKRKGDVLHSLANINKAKWKLGWKPQYDIADGLKDMK